MSSSAIEETTPRRRVAEIEQWEVGYYGSRDFGDPGNLANSQFKYVPPDGGFEALLATKRRAALGPTVTPYIIHFLRQLEQAVQNALAEEQQSRRAAGGNPGDRWRSYVIEKLLSIYKDFTGKEATGSPGGRFETLCRYTLSQFGIDDKGLAGAVTRAVYLRNPR